ncbi:hypothetical protein PM082_004367 [Marasmius tenuissimus]|nr:hypothetical protein PM082_004367 [Marasmius tenuissimus]
MQIYKVSIGNRNTEKGQSHSDQKSAVSDSSEPEHPQISCRSPTNMDVQRAQGASEDNKIRTSHFWGPNSNLAHPEPFISTGHTGTAGSVAEEAKELFQTCPEAEDERKSLKNLFTRRKSPTYQEGRPTRLFNQFPSGLRSGNALYTTFDIDLATHILLDDPESDSVGIFPKSESTRQKASPSGSSSSLPNGKILVFASNSLLGWTIRQASEKRSVRVGWRG